LKFLDLLLADDVFPVSSVGDEDDVEEQLVFSKSLDFLGRGDMEY